MISTSQIDRSRAIAWNVCALLRERSTCGERGKRGRPGEGQTVNFSRRAGCNADAEEESLGSEGRVHPLPASLPHFRADKPKHVPVNVRRPDVGRSALRC